MSASTLLDDRFRRSAILPRFGAHGQETLLAARVVVVGAGGLGSSVLPVLVAAGVGDVVVVDDDRVEPSNLARQTLHGASDVGRSKVASAVESLRVIAHGGPVAVDGIEHHVDAANAAQLIAGADVVVDATDSPAARYALDDAAAAAGVPLVWGSALGWTGQVGVAWAARGPRWRDLFPVEADATDTCETTGVLPSLCTTIGGLMATEVLKLVTDVGDPLIGRLLVVDAERGTVREVPYARADASEAPPAPKPDDARAAAPTEDLTVSELADRIGDGDDAQLLDVRQPWEAEIASLPGAILIPLGQLPDRIGELDPAREVLAYCHGGVRSAQAAQFLRDQGFRARSVAGGIDAWSRQVDPSVPRY